MKEETTKHEKLLSPKGAIVLCEPLVQKPVNHCWLCARFMGLLGVLR
jgi:hypothetical protein